MASFVLVGETVINLDAVSYVGKVAGSSDRRIHFDDDHCTDIRGEEAAALDAYLRGMAIDVVDYHHAVLDEARVEAERAAQSARHIAQQSRCTQSAGHMWRRKVFGRAGYVCVGCERFVELYDEAQLLALYGGVMAETAALT